MKSHKQVHRYSGDLFAELLRQEKVEKLVLKLRVKEDEDSDGGID